MSIRTMSPLKTFWTARRRWRLPILIKALSSTSHPRVERPLRTAAKSASIASTTTRTMSCLLFAAARSHQDESASLAKTTPAVCFPMVILPHLWRKASVWQVTADGLGSLQPTSLLHVGIRKPRVRPVDRVMVVARRQIEWLGCLLRWRMSAKVERQIALLLLHSLTLQVSPQEGLGRLLSLVAWFPKAMHWQPTYCSVSLPHQPGQIQRPARQHHLCCRQNHHDSVNL